VSPSSRPDRLGPFLDGAYGRGIRIPPVRRPVVEGEASEYMTCGRVFVSCEPEEKTLRYVPEFFPADNILFASDYPHWDGQFPDAVSTLADRSDIAEGLKHKIFFDNPQRFLWNEGRPPTVLAASALGRGETMPKIPAERLSEIGRALFVAAGTHLKRPTSLCGTSSLRTSPATTRTG